MDSKEGATDSACSTLGLPNRKRMELNYVVQFPGGERVCIPAEGTTCAKAWGPHVADGGDRCVYECEEMGLRGQVGGSKGLN